MIRQYLFLFCLIFLLQETHAQIDHWETAVYASDEWRYHLGTSNPENDWKEIDFDDSGWESGTGGIGYGDNDDGTVIQPVISVFIRKKFEVVDLSKIDSAILHADYDDGYVAYLNGVEITRSFVLGFPPPFDQFAFELHEATLFSGGQPEAVGLGIDALNQLLVEGENVLTVQVHNYDGAISSDMSSNFFLSFGINDASNDYGPTPSWFISPSFHSHLPIVQINSFGEYIPDEPSIPAEMGIVWNGVGQLNYSLGAPNEFFGNVSIERRGQSSLWLFPKNSFAVESKDDLGEDMDVSFLNFPEEEDWILHGPYSDKTLMRNVLTAHIAEQLGQYATRTRYVELVINEQYEGIYILMEKIKRDKNRVDIADLNEDDLDGDELTGGYVFKVDKDEADWYSQFDMEAAPGDKLEFQYVSPKRTKIQPAQEQYIQSYVDSFEQAIRSNNWMYGGKRYNEYIDLPSFVDNFIINELSKNVDAFRLSSYFHKDKESKGGKIVAGPIWDFNLSFGNADYCDGGDPIGWIRNTGCGNTNPFWWSRMLQDPIFSNLLKCRWEELREGPLHLDSLTTYIDERAAFLTPAVERNFNRWPILDIYIWPNATVTGSFQNEIDYMKSFIETRLSWMDNAMFGNCTTVFSDENYMEKRLFIHPNPVADVLEINIEIEKNKFVDYYISSIYGEKLKKGQIGLQREASIDMSGFTNGTYFLTVHAQGDLFTERFVLLK